MGDIAASGGVWVTTLSDEIWAKPETLTGSIGVYGLIPTLDGIFYNYIHLFHMKNSHDQLLYSFYFTINAFKILV